MASAMASSSMRSLRGGHAIMATLTSPYQEVHALMVDWEDAGREAHEFRDQKEKLAEEFRKYRFKPKSFAIPSKKPYQALLMEIHQFLQHDKTGNLLIIYYGGHGANNKDKDHIWYCHKPTSATMSTNPKVNWTSIQGLFQDECQSHVLFVLDCCYSAAVARYAHASSTVEAMVAAGFERVAPLRGAHSFTMFLIKVLKDMREGNEAAYADVVCRMVSAQLNRTDPAAAERSIRATPHHIPFSNRADKIVIGINFGMGRSIEDTRPVRSSSPPVEEVTADGSTQAGNTVRGPQELVATESPAEDSRIWTPTITELPGDGKRPKSALGHNGRQSPDTMSRRYGVEGYSASKYDAEGEGRKFLPKRTYTGFSARLSANILDQSPPHTESRSTTSTTAAHPVYRSLLPDEIRLLHLQPSKKSDEPIVGHLTIGSLSERRNAADLPPYKAVSWHWGDKTPVTELYLLEGENHNRHPIPIPASLHNALRAIRDTDTSIIVWIDYVCCPWVEYGLSRADQLQEIQHHFRLMPLIFERASGAIIWLGNADDQTQEAMDFVERVADLEQLDGVIRSDDTPKHWDTLVSLMRRPWFSRRWNFQEIIIAKRASIYCGKRNIPWDKFSDAVTLLGACYEDVQYRLKRQEISNNLRHTFNNLVDLRALEAYSVVDAGNDLFRRQGDGSILSTCSLEALVSALPALQSANPRDIIYALFAISTDNTDRKTDQVPFDIDYSKPKSEVFQNFVRYCVETSKSLDIICRPWAPNQDTISVYDDGPNGSALPSWVCQVRNLPFGHRRKHIYGRKNGDVLVGHPHRRTYNASRRSVATPLFGRALPDGRLVMDGTMVVSGFPIGRIDEIGFRAAAGTIHMEWIEMCDGWKPAAPTPKPTPRQPPWSPVVSTRPPPPSTTTSAPTWAHTGTVTVTQHGLPNNNNNYVPDHLWRTLVADRGPNGTPTPTWYHRACQYWLEYSEGQDVTYDVIQRDQHPATALDYIQRVQSVVWDRRLFKIEKVKALGNRTLYGLAPRGAREGDWVCVLHGCSVPVVLRARNSNRNRDGLDSNDSSSSWELIGECFVYGMMDGEAMEVEDFLRGTREFEIC
ncbi:heterokaryon incompatibility protein-domain-containing protein [Apiospora rasikravindrae]|uniref:Heterokaryon incompatibility protein-domain-containing protein n=1 Tax=Apiospora rasikravindrae TaxID=990691 RepID=A0ABR1SIL3_9PEZI